MTDLANSKDSEVNIEPLVQALETVIAEGFGSAPARRGDSDPYLPLLEE